MPVFFRAFLPCEDESLANRVKNNIIGLAALGKILLGVINDLIGAQRFHQFQIRGAAYPGHFCPKVVPGKLYRKSTYRSRSAINQNFLSAPDISFSETMQCCHPPTGNGGGFLIGYIGRFYGQHPVFRQTFVLGISAKIHREGRCKNLVTSLESCHILAD